MYRRITLLALLPALFLGVLLSCDSNISPIGAGIVNPLGFDVSLIDSVLVRTSTVVYDSILTSAYGPGTSGGAAGQPAVASGRFLVGHHVDEKLGPITASTIFQLTPPPSYTLDPDLTEYQKLSLFLTTDGYYYYDTTQTMTINVYKVINKIIYYNGYRYNIDTYDIADSSFLGSVTFKPAPSRRKDSVEIFLSDDLGKKLLALAQSKSAVLQSSDNLETFIHGIALVPDTTQSRAVMGFLPSPVLRLYYHDLAAPAGTVADKRYLFSLTNSNPYAIKYDLDRSATKIATLKIGTDEVRSELSDNQSYLQGGSGLAIKIDVPYIRNMNFITQNFVSTRAILTMYPTYAPPSDQTPLPKSLSIDLISPVDNGVLASGYLSASLATDDLGRQSYSVDVTSFVNGEIGSTLPEVNSLLLRLPSMGSEITRLYLGNQNVEVGKMKLLIYYITLAEQ